MKLQGILEVLEQSCIAGSQQEYLSVFSAGLDQEVGLSGSVCFTLNTMKDQLVSASSTLPLPADQSLSFSLNNTNNPVVYSLIANKPYIVRTPKLLRNVEMDLLQLIKAAPQDHAMLCYPFKYGTKKSDHGVFVFFAAVAVIERMKQDKNHQRLLNVMAGMLGIYGLVEKKDKEKLAMRDDLAHRSRDNTRKTVRQQIARQHIGRSQLIAEVWDQLARAAASEVAVILRGETGVGKDLAASLIHRYSKRSQGRFIVVNCAAIPEHLLESELFGDCKGAFTGASQNKQGLIKQADGGVLFLDEIGDLSETLQAKLLRVLQEKRFTPVGADKEEFSNFRLITATHRPLEKWIEMDRFRRDLFYRINQFKITIPPLIDRKEDIPVLVDFFTNAYMQENTVHISGYDDAAMALLQDYHYPGNIRELKNIVFQACIFVGEDNLVTQENIMTRLDQLHEIHPEKEQAEDNTIKLISGKSLPEATEHFEQKIIRLALENAGGSRSKAANTLGIPKRTLAHKCKKWSICHGS